MLFAYLNSFISLHPTALKLKPRKFSTAYNFQNNMFFLVLQFHVFYLFWHNKPQPHWYSFSSLNMSNSKLSHFMASSHDFHLAWNALSQILGIVSSPPFQAQFLTMNFYEDYLIIIQHILLLYSSLSLLHFIARHNLNVIYFSFFAWLNMSIPFKDSQSTEKGISLVYHYFLCI